MCTSSGDGVELAIFANEECTWYTKSNSFQRIAQYSNGNADDEDGNGMSMYLYSTYAENYIKSAFSEVVSCAKKQYYNPYADEEEDENEDEEQEGEVSEYCQGLMEEEAASMVSLLDYIFCLVFAMLQSLGFLSPLSFPHLSSF